MIISPSVLSANFMHLEKDIKDIQSSKATWLHYDVMDGHFVPNISFGYSILSNIKKETTLTIDTHLMISDPLSYLDAFIKAGSDYVTFHYECYENKSKIKETIDAIHKKGCKAGLSIKPNTPVEVLLPYLKDLDLVLIMSVEPGFGGQSFMPSCLEKIAFLKNYKTEHQLSYLIEVDGGINDETAKCVHDVGCEVVVAGSYIFNKEDRKQAVESLLCE